MLNAVMLSVVASVPLNSPPKKIIFRLRVEFDENLQISEQCNFNNKI